MKNTKAFSLALRAESSEAEHSDPAASAAGAGRPRPEVAAKEKRRTFTGENKQRLLAEADQAREESGGIGSAPP